MDGHGFILLLLLFGIYVVADDEIKFFDPQICENNFTTLSMKDRLEPIPGKTYFGSKNLLRSKIPEMEHFKAVFTIPKNAVYIKDHTTEEEMKAFNWTGKTAIVVNRMNLNLPHLANKYVGNLGSIDEIWLLKQKQNFCSFVENIDNKLKFRIKIIHFVLERYKHKPSWSCLSSFTSLKVLRVSVLPLYNELNMYEIVRGLHKNVKLQVLSFHGLYFNDKYDSFKANKTFSHLKNRALFQYLSITGVPHVKESTSGLTSSFPCLKVLQISTVNEVSSLEPLLLDALYFHQNIMYVSVKTQKQYDSTAMIPSSYMRSFFKTITPYNYTGITAQCKMVQKFLRDKNFLCAKALHFEEDKHCLGGVRFPLSPRLQEIHLTQQTPCLDYWLVLRHGRTEAICFAENNLTTIETSHTTFPTLGSFKSKFSWRSFQNVDAIKFENTVITSRKMKNIFDDRSFPNLKTLSLRNGKIKTTNGIEICRGRYFLELLDISHNQLTTLSEHFFNNCTHLQNAILSYNQITHLPSYLFLDCDSLHNVSFTKNALKALPNSLFTNCRNLQNVFLAHNTLHTLPVSLFSGCRSLQNVFMSHNRLHNLPSTLFSSCEQIRFVDLSDNILHSIPVQMHHDFERFSTFLDLTNNLMSCDCDPNALETMYRLKHHRHRFKDSEKYLCRNLANINFVHGIEFEDHKEECEKLLMWQVALISVCVTAFVISTCLLTAFILYRYRYLVITCCYHVMSYCGETRYGAHNVFDLYLMYCREDRDFVHTLLVPVLEEKHGLKCCVHIRDFPAAGDIDQIICKYMKGSKDILALLSENSITKKWPTFELQYGQELERTAGKRMFYVILDSLGSNIPERVSRVLDAKVFIKWPGSKHEQQVNEFFRKLVATIYGQDFCCGVYPPCLKSRKIINPEDNNVIQRLALQKYNNLHANSKTAQNVCECEHCISDGKSYATYYTALRPGDGHESLDDIQLTSFPWQRKADDTKMRQHTVENVTEHMERSEIKPAN